MFQNILSESTDGITTITINRPDKLNALNIQTLQEIKQAVIQANANKEIRGIILTGSGIKAFAAGADIAEFANFTVEQGNKMSADGHAVLNTIESSGIPVIAAINGFALGGGCELAMACHLRIASSNAKFGQPEVNLGLIPGYAGTQRLIQLIGRAKALELLMTAEVITADEALQIGLVNYVVVNHEELKEKCHEIMNKIKSKSPLTISSVIKLANDYYANNRNGFDAEIKAFGECFGTEDFKEGTTAFLNKTKPEFKGR